uniref:Uncharacterized protein n=1 Tax=Peronospora matthiolae TaxID=2874970 RepID=A0AAV1U9K9_9STRA
MVDGKTDGPKQLMSDVLRRATLLSQEQQASCNEAPFCQADENPMAGDVILDTEHQMRAERFTPQVFSPTKPASTSTVHSRKPYGDTIVSKIRGSIGDVIRKAIRKSSRDLTLLRSHGQRLLPKQSRHSSSTASIGAIESVQYRAYVVIRLMRFCGTLPDFIAYECRMHQVTSNLEKTAADDLVKDSVLFEAHFRPQTAEHLKLAPGNLLKVFEPLHFFLEHVAAGSIRKPRWFLASTQLAQVIDDDRHHAE